MIQLLRNHSLLFKTIHPKGISFASLFKLNTSSASVSKKFKTWREGKALHVTLLSLSNPLSPHTKFKRRRKFREPTETSRKYHYFYFLFYNSSSEHDSAIQFAAKTSSFMGEGGGGLELKVSGCSLKGVIVQSALRWNYIILSLRKVSSKDIHILTLRISEGGLDQGKFWSSF